MGLSASRFCFPALLAICGMGITSFAQEKAPEAPKESPYEALWHQVGELLGEREYGSAAEILADAESDPDLAQYKDRLKVDKQDVAKLQRFAEQVKEAAAALKSGDTLKVGSLTYKVQGFKSTAQGDRLTLEGSGGTAPSEKSLAQLDYRTWIDLTKSRLTTSGEDRYVVGMFLASVDRGSRKEARDALNLAANDKLQVSHWIDRLDAETRISQQKLEAKKQVKADPILGTWRMIVGNPKNPARVFNETFRSDGRTSIGALWRKRGDGHYVVTIPGGGTSHLTIDGEGERLHGKTARGANVQGLRQAKAKR